jgi:DNA-binding GntR family transcriptional regulator
MYRISDKHLGVDMIGQLRNRASLYINMVARSGESRTRAQHEHGEMVEALVTGDADRLEELIRTHLRATLSWVESQISES